MWICDECGRAFSTPAINGKEYSPYDVRATTDQAEYLCPECGGEAQVAAPCRICARWISADAAQQVCGECEKRAEALAAEIRKDVEAHESSLIRKKAKGSLEMEELIRALL